MKKRMLQDVMGPYNLPPLSDGQEVLAYQIEHAEYFLDKMRAHEGRFQQCFERDDLTGAKKQRRRFVFNFAAFLSSSRIFVYMLRGLIKESPLGTEFVEHLVRTRPFRAFAIMRDANTHRVPLHYSLTYKVTGRMHLPLQGVMPLRMQVNMLPHLQVTEPPCISLDINRVQTSKNVEIVELASFIQGDERRNSLIYMCAEFLGEMRSAEKRVEPYVVGKAADDTASDL